MKNLKRLWMTMLLAMAMVLSYMPFAMTTSYAAVGDPPEHAKILQVNEDGTFTLALNIKGDSEKKPNPVNVIVIIDRSGSMDEPTGNTGYTYTATNSTGGMIYQNNLYGLIDGEYHQLTRTNEAGWWQSPDYHFWYNGQEYTGQRYTRQNSNQDRLEAAQEAANQLASALLAHNGQNGNANDTVEIALVSFSTHATTDVNPTTSYSTFETGVNGLNHNGGTNWEAAFSEASDVDFNDNDPTYVIFLSDGLPTYRDSANGYTDDWIQRQQVYGDGQEGNANVNRCYAPALTAAQSLLSDDAASNTDAKRFYTIFAYGETAGANRLKTLTTDAGAPESNNYSAQSTAALQEAFAAILENIELAGIGNVNMEDGTTSNVATNSGIAHLLDVDESSFKYYRAGGDDGNGGEKYPSATNKITDAEGNDTNIGVKWTGSDVPPAEFDEESGAVVWDLGDDFILENDVTYTVTFDCWPSQYTLDLVADIKNDSSVYEGLDPAIKEYLDSNGNLKTNTDTSITWTDTRPGGGNGSSEFNTVDPVATTAVEQLAVTKKWENVLDKQAAEALALTVTRDGQDKYDLELSNNNDWTESVYISTGIMRTNGDEVELLTSGHDFTFTEPANLGYYWELEVPVVRPMIIDGGDPQTLVRVDEKHPGTGKTHYTLPDYTEGETVIPGGDYYLDNALGVALNAVNHRRSVLNLTKVVDGEDADPDQEFQFTLNVVDSKAKEGSADNPNSDYYVWFSVWNDGYVDALVSGPAEKEMKDGAWTGYYYAPSGSNIVVNLKVGDNLRFLNLPVGSTYTFTEGTLPANYAFTSSGLVAKTWDDEGNEVTVPNSDADPDFSGAKTTTGSIDLTNTDYTVTYTNTYGLTDVEITKVWDDVEDDDGSRPSAEDFVDYLTLKADEEDVTDTYADNLAIEFVAKDPKDPNDKDKYIVKWTGLDRYADGEEITYTVEESAIEGYDTVGSPAKDHGTITNTHEPVLNIPVEKKWVGPAGTEVTVKLYAGNDPVTPEKTLTLNARNSWKGEFTGLPKYVNGEEVAYKVVEAGVSGVDTTKYSTSITGSISEGFTITNTNTEPGDVTVTKVWVDNNNKDGIRPTDDDFAEKLKLGGLPEGVEAPTPTVTKSDDGNSWTYTWSGLPKYDSTGTAITYTITEIEVPKGYTCKTTEVASGGTIMNTHASSTDEFNLIGEKKIEGYTLQGGEFTFKITGEAKAAEEEPAETETPDETTTKVENKEDKEDKKEDNKTVEAFEDKKADEVDKASEATKDKADKAEDAADEAKDKAEKAADEAEAAKDKAEKAADKADEAKAELEKANDAVEDAKKALAEADETNADEAKAELAKAEDAADEAKDKADKAVIKANNANAIAVAAEKKADEAEANADKAEGAAKDEAKKVDTAAGESKSEVTDKKTEAAADEAKAKEGTDKKTEDATNEAKSESSDKKAEDEDKDDTKAAEIECPMPKYSPEVQNKADGSIEFGEINFTQAGTYTYTITEVKGDLEGVTYDEEPKTVIVVVKDDGNGKLVIDWDKTTPNKAPFFTFTNKYDKPTPPTPPEPPKPGVSDLTVTKTLVGHDMKDGDFSFILKDADGKIVKTAKNKADGSVTFENITFDKAGTYTFTITETKGGSPVITYDSTEFTVTATVTNNGAGQPMKVVWSGADAVKFVNTYNDKVYIDPPVTKVVKGNPKKTETYTFKMEADDPSYPMPDAAGGASSMTLKIKGSGTKEFGNIYFTEPGEYTYTVTEVEGDNTDCEYDGSVYTVTAIVTEDPDTYQLSVKTIYEKDGKKVNTAVFKFVNTYEDETTPDEPDEPSKPSKPSKPHKPNGPDTGDTNNIAELFSLMGASALGLIYMAFRRRREQE